MFGREFISIILRNLSSIQPALRDVNRNSGRNPYPKISVKTICQRKSLPLGFIAWLDGRLALLKIVRRTLLTGTAILKAPAKRTECDSKDAKKHNGHDHANHPRNVFSRSSDNEPRSRQRENESDQINIPWRV